MSIYAALLLSVALVVAALVRLDTAPDIALAQAEITCEPAISLGGPGVIEAEPGTTVAIPYTASVTVANASFIDLSVAIGQPAGLSIVYSPTNQTFQTAATDDPQTLSFDGEVNALIPADASPGSSYVFGSNTVQATCFGPDSADGVTTSASGNAVEIVVPGGAPTEPPPPTPTPTEPPPPTATPTEPPPPTPTPTEPPPTDTPEPTPTDEPSPTPTATNTRTPTTTRTPTATRTATPSPTIDDEATGTEDDESLTATVEEVAQATATSTSTATPPPRSEALVLDITERRTTLSPPGEDDNILMRSGLGMLGALLALGGVYALIRSRRV